MHSTVFTSIYHSFNYLLFSPLLQPPQTPAFTARQLVTINIMFIIITPFISKPKLILSLRGNVNLTESPAKTVKANMDYT